MNEKLKYILEFDENKLFRTKEDDECTNKVSCRKFIQKCKQEYKEHLEEMKQACDVARAFDFCDIQYTNTPHQGLMKCIEAVLKNAEYLWLLDFTYEQLKKVEENEIKNR